MFNTFWKLYPTKRDKVKAQRAFNKLSATDQQEAIKGVQREIEWRKAMQGQWVPAWKYAQGWLNGRCWEDELEVTEAPKQVNTNAVFDKLCSQLGVVPCDQYPEWDDPLISKALFKAGSWMEFSRMLEKKQKYEFRPKFLEAYKSLGG